MSEVDKIRKLLAEMQGRQITPGQSIDKIEGFEEMMLSILELDERLKALER